MVPTNRRIKKIYRRNMKNDIIEDLFDKKIRRNWTFIQLKDYLMGDPYNYAERTAQTYLKELREYIMSNTTSDPKYDLLEAIEQLERFATEAREGGNQKLYLETKKEIYKLKGMYVEKHEIQQRVIRIKVEGDGEHID